MFKLVKNVLSVLYSLLKFSMIKLLRWNSFHFSFVERFSPATMINIWRGGKLCLGSRVRAHSGTRLSVTPNGTLIVGDDVKFNYGCIVVARERIEIGCGVEFGPNVVIYDHDHDFRTEGGLKAERFKSSPIYIGDNTWIGAGAIILRGTTIGNDCVIGAGCVVKGEYPSGTIVIQKRLTEEYRV